MGIIFSFLSAYFLPIVIACLSAKASIRVLEKLGFRVVSSFLGERSEEVWMECTKKISSSDSMARDDVVADET